jgi:hypothetical protein
MSEEKKVLKWRGRNPKDSSFGSVSMESDELFPTVICPQCEREQCRCPEDLLKRLDGAVNELNAVLQECLAELWRGQE